MRAARRLALGLAALLAGAAGLALELCLIESAGLALGYGRSSALGLATFLAGWSLGAWIGGRARAGARRGLFLAGLAQGALAAPAELALLTVSRPGSFAASAVALLAILAVALVQGTFLPLLARAGEPPAGGARDGAQRPGRAVALLFAANLAGALLGAWLGFAALRALGRVPAAGLAGAAALVAGLVGAAAAVRRPGPVRSSGAAEAARAVGPRLARASLAPAVAVGLGTAWAITLQWVGLRLGVLWIGGMQPALAAILGASLLALAAGAASLPFVLPTGARGLAVWLGLAAPLSLWPLVAGELPLARALLGGDAPDLVRALVLVGPALLPFGALVPVAYAAAAGAGTAAGDPGARDPGARDPGARDPGARDPGARLGGLLLHEAWGALAGVPLAQLWIVPRFGLTGAVAFAVALAAPLALVLLPRRAGLLAALSALALAAFAGTRRAPALAAPPLANPALAVLAFDEDEHFAVAVVEDGVLAERTLLTDGFRAAGTGEDYLYMRALGSLPLLLHPAPRSVCVLALGSGTTLGAVARHPEVERIDVLELSSAVCDQAPWFADVNHGALGDARVALIQGDGRRALAARAAAYDVLTLEPLLPDSPFAVYLYTTDFYALARRALRPGGLVCQWVPPHALEPASFRAVLDAFARSFAWSGVWLFGAQVILVGADLPPALAPARFPLAEEPLAAALAELGLESPAALLARWVSSGERLPAGTRTLADADPWIVFRPPRRGVVRLGDLPANLAFLRGISADPPAAWLDAAGGEGPPALAALRALRAARELDARDEARQAGVSVPSAPPAASLAELLEAARAWRRSEPELVRFERRTAFLAELRAGVALLASDPGPDAARAALAHLVGAAEAQGERADVHVYLAAALDRLGSPAAEAALDAARARCPRIAATPAGRRARAELGLSDAAWRRLQEGAERGAR